MKAAIYARYSSDKQSDASIDDQIRNCTHYAERFGMKVALRFDDKALSGTSKNREGLDKMLYAGMHGEFDVNSVEFVLSGFLMDMIALPRAKKYNPPCAD